MRISNSLVFRVLLAALAVLGVGALSLYLVGRWWLSPRRDIVVETGRANAAMLSGV